MSTLTDETTIRSVLERARTGHEDLLDERMLAYDLDELAGALVPERDDRLDYTAMTTLVERYFLCDGEDPTCDACQ